eukprot:gene14037-16592_t
MKRPVERLSKLVEDLVPRDDEENLDKRGRKGSNAGWTSAFTYALLFGYGILLFSAYGLRVQTGAVGEKDLAWKLEAAEEANQALLRQETLDNSQSELEKVKIELAEHKTALSSQRQRADNLAKQQAKALLAALTVCTRQSAVFRVVRLGAIRVLEGARLVVSHQECDPTPSGAAADGHLSVKVLEGQARQLLEARHGKGKYRVVMTLGFPESAGDPQQETLVLHMAPADLVPHTVAWFL